MNERVVDCAELNEDMLGFGAVDVAVAPPPKENGPEDAVGLLKPNDDEAADVAAAVAPPNANVDAVAAAGCAAAEPPNENAAEVVVAGTDIFVGAAIPPNEKPPDAGVETAGAAVPLNENAEAVVVGAAAEEEPPNANDPIRAFCCFPNMPFEDVGGTTAVDCWPPKVLAVLAVPKIGFAVEMFPKGVSFAVESLNDVGATDVVPLPKPTGF